MAKPKKITTEVWFKQWKKLLDEADAGLAPPYRKEALDGVRAKLLELETEIDAPFVPPVGFKLVPINPTQAMIDVVDPESVKIGNAIDMSSIYRFMVGAV